MCSGPLFVFNTRRQSHLGKQTPCAWLQDVSKKPEKRLCNARRKRDGQPCRGWAVSGSTKCRLHGGKSTGPRDPTKLKGNSNAVTHGIYASGFTDEEIAILDDVAALVGTLDQELKVARIELLRIQKAERRVLDAQTPNEEAKEGFELSEIRQTSETPQGGKKYPSDDVGGDALPHKRLVTKQEIIRKRPDFRMIKDRTLARIAKLEETRLKLLTGEVEEKLKIINKMLENLHGAAGT